jgi:hypothetical protein
MRSSARIVTILCLALLPAGLAAQPSGDRGERVRFAAGASSATVQGRVRGYQTVTYRVGARAGQLMNVRLLSHGRFLYFVVRGPGSDDNLFDGPVQGSEAELRLPASGDYQIRVFLMRNAARRNEAADYRLRIGVE